MMNLLTGNSSHKDHPLKEGTLYFLIEAAPVMGGEWARLIIYLKGRRSYQKRPKTKPGN
jgi:hypothetical protein